MSTPGGSRSGPSLVFLALVVLCVLVILGGRRWLRRPKPSALATVTAARLGAIEHGLELYWKVCGEFPKSLSSLTGKFVNPAALQGDAWGRPFVYSLGADGSVTIMSYGADGRPGGERYDQDLEIHVRPPAPETRPSVASQPGYFSPIRGD